MTDHTDKAAQEPDVKPDDTTDTVSKLFDERDSMQNEGIKEVKSPPKSEEKPKPPKAANGNTPDPSKKERLKEESNEDKKAPSQLNSPELELLKQKLEKTEKVLAENHRYGRSNAQKLNNAMKVIQRFADEGMLAEEEAKELLQTLHCEGREEEGVSQHNPFTPIFKVANTELENIQKYTDDPLLQDKVNAFDYFLSVGSREEVEQVRKDLTDLLDDPLKLARKMLSIGQDVYEASYKEIQEAGGVKNYLATKDEEIANLQKKLDKLEKKLLQYEDFDKPRYRLDELGSTEGGKPANDTISALFDERDKAGADPRLGVDLRPSRKA